MGREDVEAVMEVERRCFDSPWTPGQFRHELKIPFSRTTLAWDDARPSHPAGYVCRWAIRDEYSILNLAVEPTYRRRGLGRTLVNLVIDEAIREGGSSVTLEVREKNAAARALYEVMGFAQTGSRRDYYAKGEHAIIMTKVLAAAPTAEVGLGPVRTAEYNAAIHISSKGVR